MNAFKERQIWIPMLVRNAVVFALRVDRAIPARIGPATRIWESDEDRPQRPDISEEDRFNPTRDDITHAEYILVGFRDRHGAPRPAWLNGAALGYPKQRETFRRWATWASFGKVDRDGCSMTDEQFARDVLHMSDVSLWKHVNFTCGIIADGLNEAHLDVWFVEKPKRKENRHLIASV